MKKGFTLIELLAVIVVLAILALVVTPVVLNIVENAQTGSDERSLEQYAKVMATTYYEQKMENTGLTFASFASSDAVSNMQYSGSRVNCTTIKLASQSEQIELYGCKVAGRGDYNFTNGKAEKVETVKKENIETENTVYFNVSNGEYCTKEEYESSYDAEIDDFSNSTTGYNGLNGTGKQNSCLKFYVFAEDTTNNTQTMILDHNTTSSIAWATSNSLSSLGPSNITTQLFDSTDSWVGTETLQDLTVNVMTGGFIVTSFTIKYSEHKARLITSDEVTGIIGDSTNGPLWLSDRTSATCNKVGCLNIEKNGQPYWTPNIPSGSASTSFNTVSQAYSVISNATLSSTEILSTKVGIRPVIVVSKSE